MWVAATVDLRNVNLNLEEYIWCGAKKKRLPDRQQNQG